MAPTTIELDLNKKYQTIDGFGYAITYSSCYNLMQMTPEARRALLKRIYSTTEGYGVSYARISLGCNDFQVLSIPIVTRRAANLTLSATSRSIAMRTIM